MVDRNRISVLVIFVLSLMIMTCVGCWDKKEAEDLGYVRATAVDRAPGGKVRLIAQVPNPRALGGGGGMAGVTPGASIPAKPYRNYEGEGATVFNAIREISLHSPRQLFWAQNGLVIFSEGLARQGIDQHLDFFERSMEIRRRLNHVLVTPSELSLLLDIPGTQESIPAGRMEEIIRKNNILSSRFAVVNLSEFLKMLAAEGQDAYCGVVRVLRNPTRPGIVQQPNAPEPVFILELSGAAAFRGDRFAGYLTERETRGVQWAQNKVQGGAVTVPSPSGGGRVTLEIIAGGKSRIIPDIQDGRLLATVEVRGVEADVAQSEGTLDLTRPEAVEALNRALAQAVEQEITAAADKAQELGSDVLGVGAAFHRKFPREWREMKDSWPEIFPGVEITARAEASVRRTGFIEKGIGVKP
ncbi:MAG: Ger(x)C family spore germination protein [Bacillota bacterium]